MFGGRITLQSHDAENKYTGRDRNNKKGFLIRGKKYLKTSFMKDKIN